MGDGGGSGLPLKKKILKAVIADSMAAASSSSSLPLKKKILKLFKLESCLNILPLKKKILQLIKFDASNTPSCFSILPLKKKILKLINLKSARSSVQTDHDILPFKKRSVEWINFDKSQPRGSPAKKTEARKKNMVQLAFGNDLTEAELIQDDNDNLKYVIYIENDKDNDTIDDLPPEQDQSVLPMKKRTLKGNSSDSTPVRPSVIKSTSDEQGETIRLYYGMAEVKVTQTSQGILMCTIDVNKEQEKKQRRKKKLKDIGSDYLVGLQEEGNRGKKAKCSKDKPPENINVLIGNKDYEGSRKKNISVPLEHTALISLPEEEHRKGRKKKKKTKSFQQNADVINLYEKEELKAKKVHWFLNEANSVKIHQDEPKKEKKKKLKSSAHHYDLLEILKNEGNKQIEKDSLPGNEVLVVDLTTDRILKPKEIWKRKSFSSSKAEDKTAMSEVEYNIKNRNKKLPGNNGADEQENEAIDIDGKDDNALCKEENEAGLKKLDKIRKKIEENFGKLKDCSVVLHQYRDSSKNSSSSSQRKTQVCELQPLKHATRAERGRKECYSCHKKVSAANLPRHLRYCLPNGKRYKCQKCTYACVEPAALRKHENVHHGAESPAHHKMQKRVKCQHCDYRCSHFSTLRQHIRNSHSRSNLQHCLHCEFTTVHIKQLKIHTKSEHVQERPYGCAHCQYRAFERSQLKRHIIIYHNNEKIFKCQYCHHKFTAGSVLKRHIMAIHIEEKPHRCPHCDYSATQKTLLQRHIVGLHDKRRPYRCSYCNFKTRYYNSMARHMKALHKLHKA